MTTNSHDPRLMRASLPSLDELEPLLRLPSAPCVRISATYAATDGTMPESIEVVWETAFPGASTIAQIVETLARLPRHRPEP